MDLILRKAFSFPFFIHIWIGELIICHSYLYFQLVALKSLSQCRYTLWFRNLSRKSCPLVLPHQKREVEQLGKNNKSLHWAFCINSRKTFKIVVFAFIFQKCAHWPCNAADSLTASPSRFCMSSLYFFISK